ncbi:AAA family ATPase, partial [Tamlana crocina]
EDGLDSFLYRIYPQKTLDDVILNYENQAVIQDLIQEHHRSDLLRSYNLEPRNRILLAGPPGNGKTSLAEVIAQSLMIPYYVVRYDGIIGSYLGETATRLKTTFDFIRTQECVLFFDEFDTIGKERGDIHETGEIKRVVSSLLLQIDRLPSYVVVVAATNHAELLDRAVW